MTDAPVRPPPPHQLVVVASERLPAEVVEAVVRAHTGEDVEVQVHLIAADAKSSWLDWSTELERPASTEAARRADRAAEAIPSGDDLNDGEIDPLQAIEAALRRHVADELVIVTASDEETTWLESDLEQWVAGRFGLPVTHLVARSPGRS